MRMNVKKLMATTTVVVALAGGPAVYAHAQAQHQESQNQEDSGGMMRAGQGEMMGQGDMMGMMQQMSQMMETCNNMMQGMAQHQAPETPKEGQTSGNDG